VRLTAGVLIIGSLVWDSEKGRSAWRDKRLNMAEAQTVTAPIRYGRLSESRGHSYTMVLSRLCPVGQAKLVPCSHTISSLQDLLWKLSVSGRRSSRVLKPIESQRTGDAWHCSVTRSEIFRRIC
jgi:hypothetical protein